MDLNEVENDEVENVNVNEKWFESEMYDDDGDDDNVNGSPTVSVIDNELVNDSHTVNHDHNNDDEKMSDPNILRLGGEENLRPFFR